MRCVKQNVSTIVKLLLNHVVSSVYSLMLFLIFYSISESRFIYIGSIISLCFYFGLIYSLMWNAGAKDRNSYYSANIKKADGFLIMLFASIPTIITNVVACVTSLFQADVDFAERTVDLIYPIFYYINYLFTQSMYSGLFVVLNRGASGISAWWFLASVIPAIVVGGFSYRIGYNCFRVRTLFGIKYDEQKEKIKNNY